MKDKNISLARKILLALLAVLMAVGAFLGVATLKRGGLVGSVEGALTASADGEVDETQLAAYKTAALDQLAKAYEGITGNAVTIDADGNVTSTVPDKVSADDLGKLEEAVTGINKAVGLTGANGTTGINEVVRDTISEVLEAAYSTADSAKVRAYMSHTADPETASDKGGIVQQFEALYAYGPNDKKGPIYIQVLDVATLVQDVHTTLDTMRTAEKTKATDLYKKVYDFYGFSAEEYEVPAALSGAKNCSEVNVALKAAFVALLTSADETLNEHYTTLNGKITTAIEAADTEATRHVPTEDAIFKNIVLVEETKRLEASKTAAQTALAGYLTTLGAEGITLGDLSEATFEGEKAKTTVPAALAAVNKALKDAVKSALDSLLQKDAEGNVIDTEGVVGAIGGFKDAVDAVVAVDAYTGLSDLTNTLSGVTGKLTELRADYLNTAKTDYKAFNKLLTGNETESTGDLATLPVEDQTTISKINAALLKDVNALIDAQKALKDEQGHAVISQGVKDALDAVSAAVAAVTPNDRVVTEYAKVTAVTAAIQGIAKAKADDLKAAQDAYKAAYAIVKDADCPEGDDGLAAVTGNNMATLNTALGNAVADLFTDYATGDGVAELITAAQDAIKDLVKKANEVEDGKYPALPANLSDVVTAQKNAIDLKVAKNAAIAVLGTYKTQVLTACYEGTDLDAAVAAETEKINKVDTIDAVNQALAKGKEAVLSAASLGIAQKQYVDSYKAITGSAEDPAKIPDSIAGTDAAALNAALQSELGKLIDDEAARVGEDITTEKATAAANALKAAIDLTSGEGLYVNIYNYSEVLTAQKAHDLLVFAKAQDAACDVIDAARAELTDVDRISADDQTKLDQQAADAKAAVNAHTYGEEGVTDATITTEGNNAADALALMGLKYEARTEYIDSIKAINITDPADKATFVEEKLADASDASAINEALKNAIKAVKDEFKNDSKAVNDKLQEALAKLDTVEGDAATTILDYSSVFEKFDGENPVSTAISNIREQERTDAVALYKKYYKAIKGEDVTSDATTGALGNGANCSVLNTTLSETVAAMLDALLAAHADHSAAVKALITEAKTAATGAFTSANVEATRALPKEVDEKTAALLEAIATQVGDEKDATKAAYDAYYKALIGTPEAEGETKTAYDAAIKAFNDTLDNEATAQNCTGFNAALKAAMTKLIGTYVDTITTEIATKEKIQSTIDAWTGDEGHIAKYFAETLTTEAGISAATSTATQDLGEHANADLQYAVYLVTAQDTIAKAYKAVTESKDYTTNNRLSDDGKEALTDKNEAIATELAAIKVEKTDTWANALATAKASVEGILTGLNLQKDATGINLFVRMALNAIVEQEYIKAYTAVMKSTPEATALSGIKALINGTSGEAYEGTTGVPDLNTGLTNLIKQLINTLKTGQTDATAKLIGEQSDKVVGVDFAGSDLKNANGITVTTFSLTDVMKAINDAITADVNAIKKVYTAAYKVFKGAEATPEATDLADFDTARSCAEATTTLSEKLSTLIKGLELTTDSEKVKTFIGNFDTAVKGYISTNGTTLLEGFAETVKFTIAGGSKTEYTLDEAVKEIAALRNGAITDAVTEYLAAYKAATGDDTATEATEAVATFKAGLTDKNTEEANTALKNAVNALLDRLLLEGDSKEVNDVIKDAKGLVSAAVAGNNGISDVDGFVGTAKSDVDSKRTSELNAAKAEYAEVYTQLTGGAPTDTETEFPATLKTAADFDGALKTAIKAALASLNGYDAEKDAQEIKEYLEKDALAAIDAVKADASTGISDLTAAVQGIIDAVAATRAAEKLAAINEYLAIYKIITGVQLYYVNGELTDVAPATDDPAGAATYPDVEAVIALINAAAHAAEANEALKEAVTSLVNGYVTEGDSKDAAGEAKKLDLTATPADNGISDFTNAVTTVKTAIDGQRKTERDNAKASYVAVYNALMGTNVDATDDAVKAAVAEFEATELVDAEDFNNKLKSLIENLYNNSIQGKDSKTVDDYVKSLYDAIVKAIEDANGTGNTDRVGVNFTGTTEFTVGEEKVTLEAAGTALNTQRTAEKDEAVAAYEAAYLAINGAAYDEAKATDAEKAALAKLNAAKNATELNAALKEGVTALVNGLVNKTDGKTTDSAAVEKIVADVVKAIGDLGTDTEGNLVAIDTTALTAALTVGAEKTPVKAAVEAKRAEEIAAIQAAYVKAYNALSGYTATVTAEGVITVKNGEANADKAVLDAFTADYNALAKSETVYDFGTALKVLSEKVVALVDALATDKDSKAINDYVTAAKKAVEDGIKASDEAPNFGSVKFTVKGEEKTLADIKTAVADMRTAEKDEAVAAYKAAYEAVKGAAYDEAQATDDEKAALAKLNDAKNATELNAALKEGVTALVNSLKDDDKDSKAVKEIVAGVVKAIEDLGTDEDDNIVAIDSDALTAAMQVGETDKVAVKKAVEDQRKKDVNDVKALYLETYNLLKGENVTDPADEKVSAALNEIAKATNFVEAYDALSEQFKDLVDSLRSDADSANVTALIDAIGKALTDAIAGAKDSREQVELGNVVVDYNGSELPLATAIKALDAMREKEFLEAKKAYVDAYNLVHGTQWALDEKTHELPEGADEALKTAFAGLQGEGDTLTDVNENLVKAVQALISEYFDETIHTGEVKSYLQDPAGTFGDGENNAKAVIAASSKLGNGLNDVLGAVNAVIARVEQFRVEEVALVVAEYLEAYQALVDDSADEENEAVKAFQDKVKDMQTGDANDALIEGVQALLETCLNKDEGNYAGESQAMKDLLDAQKALIGEVPAAEDTGVSDLTEAVTEANKAFNDQRIAEMTAALNAYLKAYEILTKTTPDNSITARFNDVLGSDRHTMADLIGLLGEQIGLIIEKDVKLDGDSDSVKEFLNGLKDAVETHFTTNEVPKLAIPDVSEIKIAYQGNNTLAENRAKLDERRAEERNAGKNLYKGYYEVIKGEAYQDRYATEAEKKFITDLDAAKNNAEVNEIVFNAVKALIDGWYLTDADGENVKKVATDLENALHDKFNADSALGVLAEDYEADITAILVAIDLRREQDTTIGEVNAAYDAIETDRLEAAAKGELDAAKADALAAIEEVTLGEGTVADAADALDAILVSAIDALNRKAAEGIAKQEYLDSYKNITGEDAADTDDVFTAITDAAALTAYTDAVNATLQSAVNALLDNVLVRDSKNVLKDSQATKMIVEAAKKAVWTLMQDATNVPDVSEAVKNVKTDVDAQRAAEKETANSAIDAAVEGKTYSDAVKAVLDLAALTAAAKAKVESGNYADVAAAVAQLKGQVALLDYVAALEGKVGFAEALEAAKAAAATIGETATEAEAEKAAARGLLDTQKAYAKACLKDLVKNESDSIKDSVLVEYNAKIDMAKSAEDVEALYAEAKLAVSAGRFLDSYSVLRKSFAGIGAGDKAALEAALLAFTNLDAASDAKVYLNGKTRYTSYEDEIQDMIAKADFEAAKAEAVSGVKTLAAGKTGSYFQKVANSQISKINAITYQPHKNAADRSAYLQELKDAVEKVLNETSGKLESAQPVQNAEDKMNAVLDEYLASGNYQGNTKDNLQNILDTYFDRAEEEGVTEAQLDAIVEEAKAALDAANVSTVGSSVALDNGEYAENYKGSALYGTVTTDSNNGLAKSTTVSIEKKDGSLTKAAIKDAANSGKLKAAAGTTLTEDEMKALVDGKDVITTLDISLSATAEGGLYTVKVLLPEDLRNVENIAIVYATADGGVEVFDAHVSEDGYLTFTTDHFSEFVVLGEGSVNLWWLVITLTVVLALELVALLVVLLKKNKKSSTTAASVLPLGLLALVIPMNATGICIVLGVCVVGLGVGIFFAARHKKKANQK